MRSPWRVPRRSAERRAIPAGIAAAPAHGSMATSNRVARPWMDALSGAPPPFVFGEDLAVALACLGRIRVARTGFYFHLSPLGRGRERSERVRGVGILTANSVPPHPNPLPTGEREIQSAPREQHQCPQNIRSA